MDMVISTKFKLWFVSHPKGTVCLCKTQNTAIMSFMYSLISIHSFIYFTYISNLAYAQMDFLFMEKCGLNILA